MDGVTHARARAWLHAGRFTLDRPAQAALDSHLHDCPDCRGYAAYLTAMEPALTRALHTRWDHVRPPAMMAPDSAPHVAPSAPAPGRRWAIPVLAGLITLVVVVLLAGPNLASQVGLVVYPTPTPTVRAGETATAPVAILPPPSATPVSLPVPTGLIAFVSSQDNGNGEVYVMQADGSHQIDVSNDPAQDGSPAWSPDGQQLAFISDRSGANAVYLVRPDGTDLRPLPMAPTGDLGDIIGVAWSTEGSPLVLTRQLASSPTITNGVVQLAPLDGKSSTILYGGSQPEVSPDGRSLAFIVHDGQGFPALYVERDDATRQATEVVTSTSSLTGTHDLLLGYAWSPDSTRLAYLQEGPLEGEPPDQHFVQDFSAQIYTARSDGSDRQLMLDLRPAPNGILGLNWSPDGKYILYSASVGMTGCMHLHLLEVATKVDTELGGVCHALRTALPAWSADSGSLIFTAEVENDPSQGLFVVRLNVAEALRHPAQVTVTRLPASAALSGATLMDFDPVWQPTSR